MRTRKRRTTCLVSAALTLLLSTAALSIPASAVAPNCGGTTIKKANGAPWVCSFDDEFSVAALSTRQWTAMDTANVGFRGGQECDTPKNLTVSGGALVIAAKRLAAKTRCGRYSVKYTSGGITSLGKFAQAYGRFEMRAKFPASGIGLQPAFWMIPANPKSTGRYEYGEIDIAEAYTMRADSVGAHLHYVTTPGTAGAGMRCSVPGSQTGYHTYTLEWTTTTLKFVYDGKTCWQTGWKPKAGYGGGRVAPAPFDQPFYLMVQLAVGGPKTPDNVPKQQTVFPANMYVDYVRVWK